MANRILPLRKRRDLTQKQLAELAGTTQQTVQRLEKGLHEPRFELAVAICKALGATLKDVFPEAELAQQRMSKAVKAGKDIYADDKILDALGKAGIDMDPLVWTMRMRLEGGRSLDLPLSGLERSRMFSKLQDSGPQFLVMDSGSRRFAVNPAHLLACQFTFEANYGANDGDDAADMNGAVVVWLAGDAEPLLVDAEPDFPEDDGLGQLGGAFFMLELFDGEREVIILEDIDGEDVFLWPQHIVMMSCPLDLLSPSDDEEEEGDEESVA